MVHILQDSQSVNKCLSLSGNPLPYENWAKGQPENNPSKLCLVMDKNGKMQSYSCNSQIPSYVCKKRYPLNDANCFIVYY